MKPALQSRMFWCLLIGTFSSTLGTTLPGSGAPAWLVQVLAAVSATAGAASLFLRSQDVSRSRRANPPAAR